MADKKPKSYQKRKEGPNAIGPKYRTSDYFKAKTFSPKIKSNQIRAKQTPFKVQHKG